MAVGEHGPLTVGRLGELMQLDSGTLSPLLKRMEAAGLVGRARDPEDERRVLVSVTAAGRDRLGALGDVPRQIAARSGLSREQLRRPAPHASAGHRAARHAAPELGADLSGCGMVLRPVG